VNSPAGTKQAEPPRGPGPAKPLPNRQNNSPSPFDSMNQINVATMFKDSFMGVPPKLKGVTSQRTLAVANRKAGGMLAELRRDAADCKACDLWKTATQTVFGEGAKGAVIMIVGEQPGDAEDRAGRPFVGPAGKLLDEALAQAGIDRSQVYVTNVVKHFKWSAAERGKRRIHQKPRDSEIKACRPWLDAEIAAVKPQILVCLGASAAQSLLGRQFRVTQQRGSIVASSLAPQVVATVHPSSILRARDDASRHAQMEDFVRDLRFVGKLAKRAAA
jgi:uracil-DNA glycosylase